MAWQEEYQRKTVTLDEAAALIKSGDRIMTGNPRMPRYPPQALQTHRLKGRLLLRTDHQFPRR